MITRLAAWFQAASLIILEEINELGYCRFFYTKPIQAGMPR